MGRSYARPLSGADLIETISPKNQYAREVTRRHDMALQHSYSSGNAHGMDVVSSLYGNSNALKRSDTVWRSWYSGLTSSVHWAKRSLRLGGGQKSNIRATILFTEIETLAH